MPPMFDCQIIVQLQLSSSRGPMSVLLTRTVPLSQQQALRLEWSPLVLPILLLLFEAEAEFVPSSSSVHGSISMSMSCKAELLLLPGKL
ncbi:hypothetical protein C4D60_Mb04t21990 [Musa balbisiana]|uniref:Uncharacterized protein n=1 Tax=Musa balbisiana TaxID=52838 RepID=A0A4S8KDW3_MUSBA|nr:hypothetical protein C4D60_Mb04t21990 [Musa balbisiana]